MRRAWFSDPQDTNPAFIQLTRNILFFSTALNLLVLLLTLETAFSDPQQLRVTIALTVTAVLQIVALLLALRNRPTMAKEVVPIALLLAVTYSAASSNGLHDISMLGFPVVLVVSALLLRQYSILLSTPLAVLGLSYVAYADLVGITNSPLARSTHLTDALIGILLIITLSALLHLLIVRLNESIIMATDNEQAQIRANESLLALQETLEQRIAERTRQLSAANILNDRSTRQFQITAQVARVIASIRDVNQLLPSVTRIISERFGFYHVAIYLLDDSREYAILSAASSEGGIELLERGHRVHVADRGAVADVAASGIARVVEDLSNLDFVVEPKLPDTRSEIALPLRQGDVLIGVLDAQSVEERAFIPQDVETLTTLADQVAIAIRNAQLLRDTQAAIAESQMLFGNYINRAWGSASKLDSRLGYRFTGANPTPLQDRVDSPEIRSALESGEIVSKRPASGQGDSTLIVPVKLRDETIGTISVKIPDGSNLDRDNVDIVRAASERIALALENATLLEESQRRASRERAIGEIAAKIGAVSTIDSILQTAVEELGRKIGDREIVLELSAAGTDGASTASDD